MARKNTQTVENVVENEILPAVGSPEFLQNLLDEANELQTLDDAQPEGWLSVDTSVPEEPNEDLEQLLVELDAAEARSKAYQAQESETTIGEEPSGQDQAEDETQQAEDFEAIVAAIPEDERREYGGMIAASFNDRARLRGPEEPRQRHHGAAAPGGSPWEPGLPKPTGKPAERFSGRRMTWTTARCSAGL